MPMLNIVTNHKKECKNHLIFQINTYLILI